MSETAQAVIAKEDWRDQLRGFGPLGLFAILVVVAGVLLTPPIAAVFVVLWVWLSRTKFSEIGLVKPASWINGFVIGIALGVALKFAMKAVVLPLMGAPALNETFHYLAGNPMAALEFAVYAVIGAGIGEEIVFRGYAFERLGKLLGKGVAGTLLTVIVATAIFGGLHYQQGVFGIANAGIVGFILGALYLVNQRRLYTVMVAHAAFDLTALVMIYYDIETEVSHLVFK